MDYGVYQMTGRERIRYLLFYLFLDGVIAYLFFRSWAAFLFLLPGIPVFFKDRKKALAAGRAEDMQRQFLTGMQLVSTSLQAGYAIENAFKEAVKELNKIYEEESFIVREFQYIVNQIGLNRTVESLLIELGERSHVEDIQNFAEIFYTAKRTGGDLMAIIHNTVSCIQQKQETRQEIETMLSGKRMEQAMMSVIPLFILGYIDVTSPGFLDAMYHNTAGIVIMLICLCVYLLAYFWGRKIMHIRV